ncbi:MAG: DNA-3-methyladenine glycosylase family protein [Flavobacteriaceae bacterium]
MQKKRINEQLQKTIRNAFHHLKNDEVMCYLIKNLASKLDWSNRFSNDYALSISNLIIEQQISFKAAITIKKRFQHLVKNLDYNQILNLENDKIQKIGLSFRKVEYIKNTYEFFLKNSIKFDDLSNEEVIYELTKIKGIGEWTVQMFLIFNFFRQDIFSKKDLALLNSIKKNYFIKDLTSKKLDYLIKKWKPFNSIASLLLWESVERGVFFKKKAKNLKKIV